MCQVRFPDPERGVPDPGHGGDWFGHHMVISGSSFVPLANGSSGSSMEQRKIIEAPAVSTVQKYGEMPTAKENHSINQSINQSINE